MKGVNAQLGYKLSFKIKERYKRFVPESKDQVVIDTKLLFDFDADKFVNVTGSPTEPVIMVKPVVKLIVSKPKPAS